MFKLAILLFTASAVYSISVDDSWQRQQLHVQTMVSKIRQGSNDVADSIESIKTDTDEGRRILLEQANEFSHNIQNVVYEIQQAAQNVQGEDRKFMQSFAQDLSECAHSVQQAMNAEPTQMRVQIKEQVRKIATEAEELSQHLQQAQKPQREQDNHMRAMKRAMMDIHVTVKKVEAQIKTKDKKPQDIYNKMQELANQMNTYIQEVKDDDEQAVQDLADFVQRLCQHMNIMVDKLQRQASNQQGQAKQLMQQVANKMSQMRTDLEKAANTQGNTQERAHKIKDELNKVMRDAAEEVQRLIQVVQQSNEQGKVLAKNVMVDGVAIAETTQIQLRAMKKK